MLRSFQQGGLPRKVMPSASSLESHPYTKLAIWWENHTELYNAHRKNKKSNPDKKLFDVCKGRGTTILDKGMGLESVSQQPLHLSGSKFLHG